MLLEPSVLETRQACAVKAGAAAREDTPGRGAGGETCSSFPHPPVSFQCLPLADTGVWGMRPAGSSCCAVEGEDVE